MAYESRVALQRDQLSREQAAEKKGKLEGKLETARNLRSFGLSVSDICKATGLPVETVERL